MLVRLAHEQGLLSQRSLNRVQRWALLYWLYMDRRTQTQDRRDQVKDETFHLFPERWAQLYEGEMRAELGLEGVQAEPEVPVTDVSELDKWYESVSRGEKRTMNGSQIPPGSGNYWQDWGPWQ